MNPQQQRILIMALAGIFGLLIIIGVGFTIYNSQRSKIVINNLTPRDAVVKLDGNEIKKGTHFVDPGKHQMIVSRPAFIEKKIDIDIKAGETKGFDLYIFPDGDAGLNWIEQNPEEASALDGFVSKEYTEAAERVFENNQILSQLPITERTFRIDHGFSKTGRDFALYIQTMDDAGKVAAIETLKYLGYNPDAFEIIYTAPAQ